MSEESVESIFQHACEGAAESIGSTRTDWQRVVVAIRFLRRELEAAKQWGADLSNELTHRTTKLAEARLWLDSSESALQEAQRALFRWLPNRIGSEYDDLIAADAMTLMGLESTEGLREVGGEILIELMQKRRLLDDARAQEPIHEVNAGEPYDGGIWYSRLPHKMKLYAAPVPAQPAADVAAIAKAVRDIPSRLESLGGQRFAYVKLSEVIETIYSVAGKQPTAVPEAVAKDAAAILVQALEEIAWQRPLGVRPSKSGEAMERAAIIALHKYNALLSAADTEVKK